MLPLKKTGARIFKSLKDGTPSFLDGAADQDPLCRLHTVVLRLQPHSNINWHTTTLHLDEFGDDIALAVRQFDVDPALVRALIHTESGFNPRARSQRGAMGLMQLMPGTARMVGVTDALLPSDDIRGGTKYLAGLLARFKSDATLACAACNAGPEAVQKYAGVPPYAETQVYVQHVKILHQRYRESLRG